ncbi:MarR family transcriptional regulator [Aeromicrobium sp. YIM 150415]|uniref:MarR family winged helix-turn-helix transcriptional regulator n=1 Tax=Aeromicrobium sp. YIM 150415 TaxID=2803912 RepID=UPI001963FE16|nr:MarR family transcriptional regulator [Aeromicrobium sp. YIM 150415]MBM9461962.1 MarR family transcriptional regulator [Aeromicrobium sp. YIM 150415]
MDEVDRIVAAWRHERPDADVSPMEVLSRVSRLAQYLDGLRKQAFTSVGLEPWEFDVLAALRRIGEPYELSPGQLVAATHVTSGTMTNRVDRLQRKGLVERRPAPSDRRGVLVRLSTRGRERVDAALDALLTHEHELLADLDSDERATIADLLRDLIEPFAGPSH